jgi:hypothetical protein
MGMHKTAALIGLLGLASPDAGTDARPFAKADGGTPVTAEGGPGSVTPAPERAVTIHVLAVTTEGAPLAMTRVFAMDMSSNEINAEGLTDAAGRATLSVPRRRHRIGAVRPGWTLDRLERADATQVSLVMAPTSDVAALPRGSTFYVSDEGRSARDGMRRVTVTLLGPGGAPLPGVGATFSDPAVGKIVARATSDVAGVLEAALPPRLYRIHLDIPGLRIGSRHPKRANEHVFRLEIATGVEEVRVRARPGPQPDDEDRFETPQELALQRFNGVENNPLPRVSPAIAGMVRRGVDNDPYIVRLRAQMGAALPDAVRMMEMGYLVAKQPLGAYCFENAHCSQKNGPALCCTKDGKVAPTENRTGHCKLATWSAPSPCAGR